MVVNLVGAVTVKYNGSYETGSLEQIFAENGKPDNTELLSKHFSSNKECSDIKSSRLR